MPGSSACADCPLRRFNEAGADCPGMQRGLHRGGRGVARFNEAGADCPGMLLGQVAVGQAGDKASMRPGQTAPECGRTESGRRRGRARFNEAGADCPGMHRGAPLRYRKGSPASMRPGQTAPECESAVHRMRRKGWRFNEAGADCPGMPGEDGMRLPRDRGFNEAGADCPGMLAHRSYASPALSAASMRPGQTAPECWTRWARSCRIGGCFNEAGADCPGMPRSRSPFP